MTTRVIETALAGGGGLVKTLRHSYSFMDLRGVQYRAEEAPGQDEGHGKLVDRVVPRSWHENSGYQKLEEEGMVQMRTVTGRRRESNLSLASDSEVYGACSEERMSARRRKTSSMYGTLPRTTSQYGTLPKNGSQHDTLPRTGSQYGTLPRRNKKTRPALPNFSPLGSSPSKGLSDGTEEETSGRLRIQNS